jgi:hypothetical protein
MNFKVVARGLLALGILGWASIDAARAADPLPAETRLVAAPNAPSTTTLPFTITPTATPAPDLVVTLTDLQIPAEVVSAGFVVTQGDTIAASGQLAAPATTASAPLPAASGNFTLYVFGVPNASYPIGTFTVCVAPKASPANCIQTASLAGNITSQSTAADPTVATLSTPLNVTTAGSYTFNFPDLQFPVALNTPPNLALFQGSTPIQAPITAGMALPLNAGTYTLLAIAQADQTVKSGLYGITIAGTPAGTPGATPATVGITLLDTAIPVGLTAPAASFTNPMAQTLTLTVNDYAFPGALASASALLTAGGTALTTASAAGGAVMVAAPAQSLNLWTYGSAGATAGTFSADVAGSTDLYTAAQGVAATDQSAYAYAFVYQLQNAGTYQASAADLQFPAQLGGLSFAVAQNGAILQQSTTPGSLNIKPSAGPLVLLASAVPPASGGASGNGLFDVNLQSTGASAQLLFDQTQSVSSTPALFDSQTLTVGVNANFTATLTDLKTPAAFDSLALVVSRGSEVLGKIYGGGPFTFPASPGSYQLTFVATPAAMQQFGLYGVSVVYSPPTVTLTSSAASAVTGTPMTLTWTASNATSCTASGGSWTGSKAAGGGNEVVVLTATTTYMLSCTGEGGTVSQSVSVTATTPASGGSSGGGKGSLGLDLLGVGSLLVVARFRRHARRQRPS